MGLDVEIPCGQTARLHEVVPQACNHHRVVRAALRRRKDDLTARGLPAFVKVCPQTSVRGHATGDQDSLQFLDLRILQIYRCRATENRNRHLETRFFLIDIFHMAVERREWTVANPNLLPDFERH